MLKQKKKQKPDLTNDQQQSKTKQGLQGGDGGACLEGVQSRHKAGCRANVSGCIYSCSRVILTNRSALEACFSTIQVYYAR